MQGYPILFTADTGASKTVLSKRVYESMRPEDRPELGKASKLIGAGGTTIKDLGKGEFTIKLGTVSLKIEAMVADIDDDGLLGVDVLQSSSNGPTDLMMSKGVLIINKQEVPIIQIGVNSRVRKVTAADHFVIPPQSEAVVDVYIEREEYDDFSAEQDYIIEPTEHFRTTYPLQMAPSLANINESCTGKVRLLNPFPTAVSIKQDAVVGRAEPIEGSPKLVVKQENQEEEDNYARARRISFQVKDSCSEEEPIREAVQSSSVAAVPDHLGDLYRRATTGLNKEEKERVANLLIRFQDTFSRDEWDLGLTNLTEHAIPTGNSSKTAT